MESLSENESNTVDNEQNELYSSSSNEKQPNILVPSYFSSSFENMNRLRRQETLCDVILVIGNTRIPAHKVVLAAASSYFEAMFTVDMLESRESVIELHDVDAFSVQSIVDFMYTSKIDISEDNVQALLPTSTIIHVEPVRSECCKFLTAQLSPCNCLGIFIFADHHGCNDLKQSAKSFALTNFVEVSRTEEFLHLTSKRVTELISDDTLYCYDESQVYLAVMNWIKYDLENRQHHLNDLLSFVKLHLLSRDFLMFTVEPDELIKANASCKDLIIEAMKYHLLPEMRPYLQNSRIRPRNNTELSPLLMSVGGGSLFAIHCECECYDAAKNKWFMVAPMSARRARLGVSSAFGMVYAVGGFDGSQDLSTVEVYNPKSNQWSSSTPMGTRRSSLGVATLHNLLYAIGGYDGASCLCSVERYDPLLQQWTSVAPMMFRRRYVAVGVIGEYLIVAGGYDGVSHLSSVESYDPVTNIWSLKCPMRSQRSNCASAVLNNLFYVIGGSDGSSYLDTVERYNAQENTWTHMTSMINIRSSHAAAAMDNYIFVVGGNDGSSSLKSVEKYDPKENTWTRMPPMSTRRSNLGGVVAWVLTKRR